MNIDEFMANPIRTGIVAWVLKQVIENGESFDCYIKSDVYAEITRVFEKAGATKIPESRVITQFIRDEGDFDELLEPYKFGGYPCWKIKDDALTRGKTIELKALDGLIKRIPQPIMEKIKDIEIDIPTVNEVLAVKRRVLLNGSVRKEITPKTSKEIERCFYLADAKNRQEYSQF